jgi:uncharacterized protein (TIGR00255 family)
VRGRLTVRVAVHSGEPGFSGKVNLNTSLARAYVRELNQLARELNLAGTVTLDHLLRAPGVLQADQDPADAEDFWPAVKKALDQALNTLVGMREREGAHLSKDLTHRVNVMRKSAARIQKQAPKVSKRYREQLLERIQATGLVLSATDDDRILKEVVYFADRSDISEELTRLHSHFQQFEDCLTSREPVGRTLDFLAQEMNREINTIGSKANDSVISREVVILKAELEKFREQAQNVE